MRALIARAGAVRWGARRAPHPALALQALDAAGFYTLWSSGSIPVDPKVRNIDPSKTSTPTFAGFADVSRASKKR